MRANGLKVSELIFRLCVFECCWFVGRGEDRDSGVLSFLLGAKAAGLTAFVLASMKLFVIKALIIAKFALAISMVITIAKLLHHHHRPMQYVEFEHHGSENYPVFAEGPQGGAHFELFEC